MQDLLKGGPGSGNFGHPGYPRGVAPEQHRELASYGFRLTGGDTSNGTLHVYQDGLGNKALLRTLNGKTTLAIEGTDFKVPPGKFSDVIEEYLYRSNSRAIAARHPVSKGGQGSGNYGHQGRPGQVGGSGPGAERVLDALANQPHPESVVRASHDLLARAKEVEPEITSKVKDIAKETGAEMIGLDFRLKTNPTRVAEKITEKMQETGMSLEQAKDNIYDSVRYTASFPPDQYSDGVNRFLNGMKARGFTDYDHKQKNYWTDPPGSYSGLNYVMVDKSGHKIEMQFHTPESFSVKQANHVAYEKFRTPSATPEQRKQLWDQMEARARAIKVPKNVLSLGIRVNQKS